MMLMYRSKILATSVALIGAMFAAEASVANLVVNPGFEDPSFSGDEEAGAGSGWTVFNNNFRIQCPGSSAGDPCIEPIGSSTGAHGGSVVLKNFGEAGAFQDFAASEGDPFDGSIWVLNPDNADVLVAGQIAALNIEWLNAGGTNIGTVFGDSVGASLPVDDWTQLFVGGTAPAETAFARFVLITGPFDPDAGGGGGAPRWDDASFVLVPEPGSLGLIGMGLIGLLGIRRRR